jgi:hydrogenase maturation protease
MKPVLILGLGNLLRTDDGVGVHAVNLLIESKKLPDHVEVIDAGTSGTDLPALIAGRKKVVVLDALETDAEPGSIFRFPASNLSSANENKWSLHEAGIASALKAIEILGERPDVEVIGIVAHDAKSMGTEPTPKVKAAIPQAAAVALAAASGL